MKGKNNSVRTRSSGPLDETPAPTKKSAKSDRVVTKVVSSKKPQLRKQASTVKRYKYFHFKLYLLLYLAFDSEVTSTRYLKMY